MKTLLLLSVLYCIKQKDHSSIGGIGYSVITSYNLLISTIKYQASNIQVIKSKVCIAHFLHANSSVPQNINKYRFLTFTYSASVTLCTVETEK